MTPPVKATNRISLSLMILGLLAMNAPAVLAVDTSNKSIRDLQSQKNTLEKQIKNDEANKKKKQEEQQKYSGQINSLNQQIASLEEKINDTQNSINETQASIQTKEQEITQKEQELATEREKQAETIRVIYETGKTSTLELIMSSESLSDFFVQREYLNALEEKIADTIKDIERIKGELEDNKRELENKERELSALNDQQRAYEKALESQKAEKNILLSNAKVAEDRLANQIAESERVYADVNNELTKLMEAARKRAEQKAKGQLPKGVSNVGFQYPVAYTYVSVGLGGRTPFQSFHTGVDFVNDMGTPVFAAADGVVTQMGRLSYGYGTYVIIAHNQRFSTVYAHFQDFVDWLQVGQTVKRGDPIGYIGMTGWTTGPHLHFEIREYGVPADPFDYLP